MSSVASNAAAISLIQQELANSKKIQDLTNTERREVLDVLFPQGVALPFDSPLISIGDLVYGSTPNVNGGSFCFGYALTNGVVTDASDINVRLG